MPCIPPTTRSPGFLYLSYNQSNNAFHTARWAFILGVDITDTVNLRVEANRIAAIMADALQAQFAVTDWGILQADGSHFYSEPFAAPYVGTKGVAPGADDYYSRTITFTGRGNATLPGVCTGQSRSVLFVGNTYQFVRGEKRFNVGSDVDLMNYLNALNTSTYLPADVYGQQVTYSASAPVQFNAHTQRTMGS